MIHQIENELNSEYLARPSAQYLECLYRHANYWGENGKISAL